MAAISKQNCDCCGKGVWVNANKHRPYPLLCSDYCEARYKWGKCESKGLKMFMEKTDTTG